MQIPRLIFPALLAAASASAAPALTKVLDFNSNANNAPNQIQGCWDSPVLVGQTLWFNSSLGGAYAFGTLSSFDLTSNTVKVRVDLDNETGNTPQATPVLESGTLYYTTSRGGTGDRGVLNAYNIANGTNASLWNSPTNSPGTNPNTLQGNVAIVDRGAAGKDIYMLTLNGGPGGAAYGTIQRYQTSDQSVTQLQAFTTDARQPFKGFTKVGTKLYFTTFVGGPPATGTNNGPGTLCSLDVTTRGAEKFTKLADMPVADAGTRLPANNPYYRAADNCLYITCVGISTGPGGLVKYDLNTSTMSVLYTLSAAADLPDGKGLYGQVTEWNRALYYTTLSGGTNGAGTINRFNLDTKTNEVLFNLFPKAAANNWGGSTRGTFVFNNNTSAPAFYLLTQTGGLYGNGTLLKLALDPAIAPTPFETWIAGRGLSDTTPTGDPDHDGRSNRDEFAFGSDPASGASSGTPAGVLSPGGGYEIRYTARTDGSVTYKVTSSAKLGATGYPWTTVSAAPQVMTSPDVAVPSGYERRRVMLPFDGPSNFYRVEATFANGAVP